MLFMQSREQPLNSQFEGFSFQVIPNKPGIRSHMFHCSECTLNNMAIFQTLPKSPPQLLWWRCVGLQEIYGLHLPFTLRQTPGLRSKGPNHTPPSAYTIYQNVPSAELFSFFCSNNKNFPLFL